MSAQGQVAGLIAQNGHISEEDNSYQVSDGPGLYTTEEMGLGVIDHVNVEGDWGFVVDTVTGERTFIHYGGRGEVIPGSETSSVPIVRLNEATRPYVTFRTKQVVRYMVGTDFSGRRAVVLWVPSDEYIRVMCQMKQHQLNVSLYYGPDHLKPTQTVPGEEYME